MSWQRNLKSSYQRNVRKQQENVVSEEPGNKADIFIPEAYPTAEPPSRTWHRIEERGLLGTKESMG